MLGREKAESMELIKQTDAETEVFSIRRKDFSLQNSVNSLYNPDINMARVTSAF